MVQYVFQNNEKCPRCDALNGHRYSKNKKKVEYLMGHFWEAIQTMRVKFLWDKYYHQGVTLTLNFVQFWGSHVWNFGELPWNYPFVKWCLSGIISGCISHIAVVISRFWHLHEEDPFGQWTDEGAVVVCYTILFLLVGWLIPRDKPSVGQKLCNVLLARSAH